jgi:hypothetical protein
MTAMKRVCGAIKVWMRMKMDMDLSLMQKNTRR